MTTDRVGTIVEMGKITTEHDTDAPLEDRLIEIRSEISALLRERVKGGERVGVVIETPTTQKAGKAYKNQNPARAAIYGAVVGMMIATIHGYGGTGFRNYRCVRADQWPRVVACPPHKGDPYKWPRVVYAAEVFNLKLSEFGAKSKGASDIADACLLTLYGTSLSWDLGIPCRYIIGIDPGLRTGYAVLELDRPA